MADDRDLQIRQGKSSLLPIHTLNPAVGEHASRAETENSAGLPSKMCARRGRPPHLYAMRRSVMASAARPLWTGRVSPPSLAVAPETHSTTSKHCYPSTSLPEPFSLPNRLAYPVPFRPPLPDQPDQSPILTQLAHKFAQLVPPDQWAALHVRTHTHAHTRTHTGSAPRFYAVVTCTPTRDPPL